MKYDEFKNKMDNLIEKNKKIWKQIYIMKIPSMQKVMEECSDGEEHRVRYDIEQVWEEVEYIENKIIYYLFQYLNKFLEGIKINEELIEKDNVCFVPNIRVDEATYYFDAMIVAFGTLIEYDRKEWLAKYINKKELEEKFPNRNKKGLYWQISILRNRIVHYTSGRFGKFDGVCERFENFSPKVRIIEVKKGNIFARSTLIDFYKSKRMQMAVDIAIKNRDINPFEILFPFKTAKGHGKNKPFLIRVYNDEEYFDYIESGVKVIEEVQSVLENINKLFLNKFIDILKDKEEIIQTRIKIFLENEEVEYSIKEIFDL